MPKNGAATPKASNGPVEAQASTEKLVWKSALTVGSATTKTVKVMFSESSPASSATSAHHWSRGLPHGAAPRPGGASRTNQLVSTAPSPERPHGAATGVGGRIEQRVGALELDSGEPWRTPYQGAQICALRRPSLAVSSDPIASVAHWRSCMETIYEHAGGGEALHRLEELFYDKVLADPVLSTVFTERVPTHIDHLTWFTAEYLWRPGHLRPRTRIRVHHRRPPSYSGSPMSRSSDS